MSVPRQFVFSVVAQQSVSWLPASTFEWVAVPDSNISAAGVSPGLPTGAAGGGTNGAESVVNEWGSMVVRPTGSHLILHGGGHNNYGGNEIYTLSLNTSSPAWVRRWGPTPSGSITTDTQTYADGNPASVHTYHRMHWDESRDALLRLTSGRFYGTTDTRAECWSWKWTDSTGVYGSPGTGAGQWESITPYPNTFTASGPFMAKHPTTGDVWLVPSASTLNRRWNAADRTWSSLSSSAIATDTWGAPFIDPATNCMYWAGTGLYAGGGNSTTYPSTLVRMNLSTLVRERVTITGTGASVLTATTLLYNIGSADYDPISGLTYYCRNGQVVEFNPTTLVATLKTMSGVTPTAQDTDGLWGRFRYVPELNGFALLPQWNSSVYFFKVR